MVILVLKINAIYKKVERNKNIIQIIERDIKKKNGIRKDSVEKIKNYINNRETNSSSWIREGELHSYNTSNFPRVNFNIKEISKWPESTHIRCWYCTRKFKEIPIGIPTKHEKDIFYLEGCFCSFKCANSWNCKFGKNDTRWDRETLLYLLFDKMGNEGEMGYAPPKELMKEFGGKLSSLEYGRLLKCNKLINVRNISLVSVSPNFDSLILTDDDIITNNINSSVDINSSETIIKINPEKKRIYRKNPIRKNNKLDKIFKKRV